MSRWVRRSLQLGMVLLVGAIATTCVTSNSERCSDDSVCPENFRCIEISEGVQPSCASPAQLDACRDAAGGTACSLGTSPGTCFGGACFPASCGDHIVDLTEACDDGNRTSGDQCSADCRSTERCGDMLTDLAIGEQCDEGRPGLSGDGCSSGCINEYALWRSITPRAPLLRVDHAIATDPSYGVLVFGGASGSGAGIGAGIALGDMWRWDGATWSMMVSAASAPSRRAAAALAYDARRDRVVLFGGSVTDSIKLDDLWEWDGITWVQQSPAGARPSARRAASFACSTSRCVLFGGLAATPSSETWAWDGSSWSLLGTGGPTPRSSAALSFDSTRNKFVLFGGVTGANREADTWELDGDGDVTWTRTATTGPSPSFRPSSMFQAALNRTLLVVDGAVWSYDGTWTDTGMFVAGSYLGLGYDAARGRVVAVETSMDVVRELIGSAWIAIPNVPGPIASSLSTVATYDPRRGTTIALDRGGVSGSFTIPRGTWEWNGLTWRRTATSGGSAAYPPSLTGAAIAFDVKCGEAVLFGGESSNLPQDQTWRYDGVWTNATGVIRPPKRDRAMMTYDARREVIVLFGGRAETSGQHDDVWEWTGACGARTWEPRPTSPRPPARFSGTLTYDPIRAVSVLFGGAAADALSDVWTWDGLDWRQIAVASPSPSARFEHAMAYEPRRRELILFGGRLGPFRSDETWAWNGVAWNPVSAVVSPPERSGMALAQDRTGHLIGIGGDLGNFNATDVWRFQSETNFEPTERCQLATVDLDGDGLMGCEDPDCGPRCAPLCEIGDTACTTEPRCGDATCSSIEDHQICPADCPP